MFLSLIGWNQGHNRKKIKVWWSIKGQFEEIQDQRLNAKGTQIQGPKLVENKGEIEKNWKLNGQLRINLHKSKTKDYDGKGTEIRGYS